MREKLIELLVNLTDRLGCQLVGYSLAMKIADRLIANGVTIPVRRKDCKHYGWQQEPCHGRTQDFCKLHKGLVVIDRDTFCPYGERKDNGI